MAEPLYNQPVVLHYVCSLSPLSSFVIKSGDFYKLHNYQLLLNIISIIKGYPWSSNWKVGGKWGNSSSSRIMGWSYEWNTVSEPSTLALLMLFIILIILILLNRSTASHNLKDGCREAISLKNNCMKEKLFWLSFSDINIMLCL